MDDQILCDKLKAYCNQLVDVESSEDIESALQTNKRLLEQHLILYRQLARNAIADEVFAEDKLRTLKRMLKKQEQSGIQFPIGAVLVKALEGLSQEAHGRLVSCGAAVTQALDLWQTCGATLEDLCNLCNRDYNQVLEEIKPERADREFSSLIFVYNLDYKDPRDRGWISFDVDAPLTHAVKEYFLDLMINTPEGRAATHQAMEECFPGIMEGALTEVTDADGTRHLIDKDGVEVGTLDT